MEELSALQAQVQVTVDLQAQVIELLTVLNDRLADSIEGSELTSLITALTNSNESLRTAIEPVPPVVPTV